MLPAYCHAMPCQSGTEHFGSLVGDAGRRNAGREIQMPVREENPILYSHKTQLNIKLSLLQHYNMFRPKLSAIFRLYMKPI